MVAVSACFGKVGLYIGSVKADLGHAGCAGAVEILKAILVLKNRTINPPSDQISSTQPFNRCEYEYFYPTNTMA